LNYDGDRGGEASDEVKKGLRREITLKKGNPG